MKKLSLLFAMIAFLAGNVFAQAVVLQDDFEAYTVFNKIALEAQAAGNDFWTTWSGTVGAAEDGVVAELNGSKCGHFTYGNDQVLLLGGMISSRYEVQFDMYVPAGKDAYVNVLHVYNGSGSSWATEVYFNHSDNGTAIETDGAWTNFTFPFDTWFTVKFDFDLDNDVAKYYIDGNEIHTWVFSTNASGGAGQRKLDAVDFYPPTSAAVSEYYVDNIIMTRIGEISTPSLVITPDVIDETLELDDAISVPVTIDNTGSGIGDWYAWLDFGHGGEGTDAATLEYHTGSVGSNIGSSSAVTREMGMRLPGSVYGSAAMGLKITKVKYMIGENYGAADGTYTFRVYGPGANNQPGDVLAVKSVTTSTLGTWIETSFDEDVYLTGQTVWVTVGLNQNAEEYPLTMDDGTYAQASDGNWLSTQGGEFDHCWQDSFKGAWLITVECEGELIPGSWATLSAYEGSVLGHETETVTLTLNSFNYEAGVYESVLYIRTNDEGNPEVQIPVTMTAGEVGVMETSENVYSIYPNPTSGVVAVDGENINVISIYNAAGQLVNIVRVNGDNATVDMSSFGAGVYYFNVIDNANNTTVQRVVVK